MAEEIWRPVVGYEGAYEISDRLRVRSLPRIVPRGRGVLRVPERVLAAAVQCRHGREYLQVALSVRGQPKRFYAHKLMAEAFGDEAEGLAQAESRLASVKEMTKPQVRAV